MEELQSAYRSNYSTETALPKVQADILDVDDNKSVMFLVLSDLSTACDMVNYIPLLNRLKCRFEIEGIVLSWIEQYLIGRIQRVVIDNPGQGQPQAQSPSYTLTSRVPQYSVLGPILFTLYMSLLGNIFPKHNILYSLYVDDQQNYLSSKPSIAGDKTHCLENLQNGLDEICTWMQVNLLKLNDKKMEFILSRTVYQLKAADSINTTIQIGNDIIQSL